MTVKEYVKIETSRDAYGAEDVLYRAMTVGELLRILEDYDEETPVVLSFDRGYTYGSISKWDVELAWCREEEE